ncbi:hypothetical protein N9O88_00515 [bacterium]|nr:hypothetical protein [bacterium]
MSAAYKISHQEVVEGLRKSCSNIRVNNYKKLYNKQKERNYIIEANLEKKNIELNELKVLLQSKEDLHLWKFKTLTLSKMYFSNFNSFS